MERSCDLYLSAEFGVHDYLAQCAKSHRTGSPFQQMKTLKTSAINNDANIYNKKLDATGMLNCPDQFVTFE